MSVDQLTVQQLKIFLAVYKHKSASLAAAELGVTNSTVSRALAAARSVFDDVLFVRTANGFVPTNKAHELASPTSDIVSILRKIDTRYTRFLPATCTGSIEIRAYDDTASHSNTHSAVGSAHAFSCKRAYLRLRQ